MRDRETIRKNLCGAERLRKALTVLTESQILEAAECLKGCDPSKAREFFEDSFQKPSLSAEMLRLSVLLTKEKKEVCRNKAEKITVSCIKNPLSLEASRKLCAEAKTVILAEEADFRSVCEAVSSKDSDYCILPMCSSQDGYYPTFSKLLKSYDLKICKVCRISKKNSDEEILLALLSRKIELPEKPRCVAFSFVCDEPSLLTSLVGALSSEGCIVQSVVSSPVEYNADIFEHRVEALLGNLPPSALLFFLEAALPRHIILGIY